MREEIISLYESGHTLEEVAFAVGISRSKVYNMMRNWGVKLRRKGARLKYPERDAAIIADRNSGMTFREIAEKHGMTLSNVYRIVVRHREEQRERAA